VTWRYSCDHPAVLARRLECREAWLLQCIEQLNSARKKDFPESKKKFLLQRLAIELVEFLCVRSKDNANLPGRISGSLAWRVGRGETEANESKETFVFRPNKKELEAKRFWLVYSTKQDCYIRVKDEGKEMQGWQAGVYECKGMFRKVENDWKMTYLAREEGRNESSLSWKFDFQGSGLKIDFVKMFLKTDTFEDGVVEWKLCGGDKCIQLPKGESCFRTAEFRGDTEITLHANLSRGKGENAWQHTQLFRQSLDKDENHPFEIIIALK